MKISYEDAGVSIDNGNTFVEAINLWLKKLLMIML